MLKSIRCDKFLSMNEIREPIIFHRGLNTVLGSVDAKNSIGKSTLLMIIDFVFGGTDYLNKKTKDVITNIGHHTFEFSFEFGTEILYFSRSTESPNFVNICNENYDAKRTIPLELYNKSLGARYKLNENGISLRDSVGRFFRVYHRETTDENVPLRAATQEKINSQITALIKLFNKYNEITSQDKIKREAEEKLATIKKAMKFKQIKSPSTKREHESNKKEIHKLEHEINELLKESQSGLSDLDALKAQELSEIKQSLSALSRQRTQIQSQIRALESDKDHSKKNFKHDYESLRKFFPEADFQSLDNIEAFHSKLSGILNQEFRERINELNTLIDLISEDIKKLQKRAKEVETTPDLSKALLIRYAELSKSIMILREANANFDEKNALNELSNKEKEKYENLIKDTLICIQNELNTKMREYNDYIYAGVKTSPEIELIDSRRYNFQTPNDTGTGSLLRGLIIFDLAMLNMTKLPAVIHDTIVLKHIDDPTIEKLLELYLLTKKQVFIAFDRDTTYSKRVQEILRQSKVIQLNPGGNELFGRSWNELSA